MTKDKQEIQKMAEEFYLDLYNLKNRDSNSDFEKTITYAELINFSVLFYTAAVEDMERDLTELRDELYGSIPSGQSHAFDLIKVIQSHIKKLDSVIDRESIKKGG